MMMSHAFVLSYLRHSIYLVPVYSNDCYSLLTMDFAIYLRFALAKITSELKLVCFVFSFNSLTMPCLMIWYQVQYEGLTAVSS